MCDPSFALRSYGGHGARGTAGFFFGQDEQDAQDFFMSTEPRRFEVNSGQMTCPCCGYVYQDSWDFEDTGETECVQCEKRFTYERDIVYHTHEVKPHPVNSVNPV